LDPDEIICFATDYKVLGRSGIFLHFLLDLAVLQISSTPLCL